VSPGTVRPLLGTTWLVAVGVLLVGCAKERELPGTESCESWESSIQTVVVGNCATTGCHSAPAPAGAYDLGSYFGLFGNGTDSQPNLVAGSADSKLLAVLAASDATHASLASLRPTLERWAVQCQAPYAATPIHPAGLMNPASPDFHGTMLRESDWDFADCARCHDDQDEAGNPLGTFTGGKSGVSCRACHVDDAAQAAWPQCGTCHEAQPTTGAHVRHRTPGALDRAFACTTCHTMPTDWRDPGHVKGDQSPGADVVMSGLAVDPAAAKPAYDPATRTCSNVYCHGGTLADANATHPQPVWDLAIPDQATCGGCHGLAPAAPHPPNARCASCHQRVVSAPGQLDLTAHLDGQVQVSKDETPTCTSCHGGGANGAAPPPDLAGNTSTSVRTVGAHAVHLTAPSGISGRFQCSACHTVPADLGSPGHLDSDEPAEVFPVGLGGPAFADSAAPMYSVATATCTGVACHGGGQGLADDTAALDRTPRWTDVGGAAAVCGACHGIPPADGVHQASWQVTFCVTCHNKTIDASGTIKRTGAPGAETSEHIDGNLDLNQ
jgi:predicted CxxxxCH...CXXCH cytochrome family protein